MAKKRTSKELEFETGRVLVGSCLDRLKDLADGSVDSIVTDPPYELGFMGKSWDASGIAYSVELWREALRVLKPGGHLLAFGGTRTYHRMAVAIEDAGFEIRDSIHWVYGSGFPKSLNVAKAITAHEKTGGSQPKNLRQVRMGEAYEPTGQEDYRKGRMFSAEIENDNQETELTDAAKQWQGWGTALKPAHEPIVLARKPLTGTVAENVQEHGTGALNIDGCRIGTDPITINGQGNDNLFHGNFSGNIDNPHRIGRFPANIMFDEAAGAELGDTARFFYCPKPGKKERNAGLEKLKAKTAGEATDRKEDSDGLNSPRARAGRTGGSKNFHPTVKPVELMRYLCRLITPPNGTVLDPFLGSGTTAVAAILEDFEWVGCEMTADYLPIIKGRVQWAQNQPQELF